jgi:hypothetical protein
MKFWYTVELLIGTVVIATIAALWFMPHPHVSVAIPLVTTTPDSGTLQVIDTNTSLGEQVATLITDAATPPPALPTSTSVMKTVTQTPQKKTVLQVPPAKQVNAVPAPTVATVPTPVATTTKPAQTPPKQPSVPTAPAATPTATPVNTFSGSVVNILCLTKDHSRPPVSGSGTIVTKSGVILTAAHVAQMFLIADYPTPGNVSCTVRTGSPARDAYTAKLIYISSEWVKNNPNTLVAAAPTESGENDFALLVITGTTNGSALPAAFSYTSLADSAPAVGDSITVGSYGVKSGTDISALYQTIAKTSVKGRYTFGTDTVDAIALGDSDSVMTGSSGGGAINSDNQLIGTIVTSGVSDSHAITVGHTRRSFASDMDQSLDAYIATANPRSLVDTFSAQASVLGQIIVKALAHS